MLFMGKANPAVGRGTPIPSGKSWMVRTVRPPIQVSFRSIPSTPVLHSSPTHSSSSFFVLEHPLHPLSPSSITGTHHFHSTHSDSELQEEHSHSQSQSLIFWIHKFNGNDCKCIQSSQFPFPMVCHPPPPRLFRLTQRGKKPLSSLPISFSPVSPPFFPHSWKMTFFCEIPHP